MRIPDELATILSENRRLSGRVDTIVADFSDWIGDSRGGPFFPEYTDHGMQHIEDVLRTADQLMTDGSRDLLNPEDVAALVLAVLLHDCVMHMQEDGFLALIQEGCPWQPVQEFGDKPWHERWEQFTAEASRWDGQKTEDVLGEDEPPVDRTALQGAVSDGKLAGHHRLIGEFLRQHHHVLAHQIALYGVPGPDDNSIALPGVPAGVVDVAGVIARSHGMSNRKCLPYLDAKHSSVSEPAQVRAPFHMALVRVADYLQLGPKRAPEAVLRVQSLRSPLSRKMWAEHALDIRPHWNRPDPDELWIPVTPPNVELLLRLQALLKGLQHELDVSWAVIGQVYGSLGHLAVLGMTKRRVASNIDDVDGFVENQKPDYIPRHAAFRTESARLLNLLVGPLYNDDPSFAIRELIQNSVDAVRELREYAAQHDRELEDYDVAELEADVVVTVGDGDDPNWVVVHDRGIGMTEDTILHYFLTAGASLRDSDGWKWRFEEGPALPCCGQAASVSGYSRLSSSDRESRCRRATWAAILASHSVLASGPIQCTCARLTARSARRSECVWPAAHDRSCAVATIRALAARATGTVSTRRSRRSLSRCFRRATIWRSNSACPAPATTSAMSGTHCTTTTLPVSVGLTWRIGTDMSWAGPYAMASGSTSAPENRFASGSNRNIGCARPWSPSTTLRATCLST